MVVRAARRSRRGRRSSVSRGDIERPRVSVAATAPIIKEPSSIGRPSSASRPSATKPRARNGSGSSARNASGAKPRISSASPSNASSSASPPRKRRATKPRARNGSALPPRRPSSSARRGAEAKRERDGGADKRAAEQRRRQQAESELQAQIALEAEQNAARAAGLDDQYIRMIENDIKQEWQNARCRRAPGLECVVSVVQLPTGDVVSAMVASCNGDDAVRRSIESAVMEASPLPRPPQPSLFERNLNVTFRPEE